MNELRIGAADHRQLHEHLFQADRDEHGALLLAGRHTRSDGGLILTVREVHLLAPADFPPGVQGYRQISAASLARIGNRAADKKLALVSTHSHPGSGGRTALSQDDLLAHDRVFPHLLDITAAEVVCGVAFGERSAAGDVWRRGSGRAPLDCVRIVGANIAFLTDGSTRATRDNEERFDRQIRLFGKEGQARLRAMHVGVIGAGGGGSILTEQLAHLGVGQITAVDYDTVQTHNLSRIMGATDRDARKHVKKVAVAAREVDRIDPSITMNAIDGDIADTTTAAALLNCDYLFLATDTATARLVANAIAQTFLIPLIQIGAKVESRTSGEIEQIYTAVRPVFPGRGCLACAGLIDPHQLQREAATPEERENQNYLGAADVIDPSVTTLNAAAAAGALNVFLMSVIGQADDGLAEHRITLTREGTSLATRVVRQAECRWCGEGDRSRFARAELRLLPCRPTVIETRRVGVLRRLRQQARRWHH